MSSLKFRSYIVAAIILFGSPEAAVGGPLALVRNGDLITLNAPENGSTETGDTVFLNASVNKGDSMKTLKIIAAAAVLVASTSANAWWDDNDGYGRGDGRGYGHGRGYGDGYGDAGFGGDPDRHEPLERCRRCGASRWRWRCQNPFSQVAWPASSKSLLHHQQA